jgi:nucleoside-diphosphate-sugar epimerase
MRVMVTGHAGYIGDAMVEVLCDAGCEVVGLDSMLYEGCDFGPHVCRIREIRKDIRDVAAEDLRGIDAIVHLAALCNDPLGNLNPELTMEINYRASVRLARMAKDAGVRRFLFSSSCSMYGAADEDILDESAPLRPLTAYAESKVRAEEEISSLAGDGFSPVFMRNATCYGSSSRLRADVVLNNLACWAFTTGRIRIMSDGTPWRPIVHIEDVARAFLEVLRAPREAIHNQAFNVGCENENYQVSEIAEIVREVMPESVIEYAGKGGPDPRNYRVSFAKLHRTLPSFWPRWTARLGAQQLCRHFRKYGLGEGDFPQGRFIRLAHLNRLMESNEVDSTLRRTVPSRSAAAGPD